MRPPRTPIQFLRDYYKKNTSDLCSDVESCPVSWRSKSDNGGENAARTAPPSDYISCIDDRSSGCFSGSEYSHMSARREAIEPARQQGTFYRDNWRNRRFIPPRIMRLRKLGLRI